MLGINRLRPEKNRAIATVHNMHRKFRVANEHKHLDGEKIGAAINMFSSEKVLLNNKHF